MHSLLVLVLLLYAAPTYAETLTITSGVYTNAAGGIQYSLFGDGWSLAGTDQRSLGMTLNGVEQPTHSIIGLINQSEDGLYRGVLHVRDEDMSDGPTRYELVGAGTREAVLGGSSVTFNDGGFPPPTVVQSDVNVLSHTPEPSTWLLLGSGVLWLIRRR